MDRAEVGGDPLRGAVLGPVRVRRGTAELDLGSRQMRLMVALLLAAGDGIVGVDDFVALLWGAEPPAHAVNVVHRHIGVLRRLFEPDLPPRAAGHYLERQAGGYRLAVASDLVRFRELVAAARQDQDLAAYVEALELWRGRCAADLDGAAVFAAVDRERSLVAREAADSALACGQAVTVRRVLTAAAEQDPLDEPLQARLILALAAAGDRAEAVRTYTRLRERLADELGMDPGAEVRAAYETVRRQREAGLPRPAQLPATTRFFNGRAAEMRALSELLPRGDDDGPVTVAIDGIPGVGKSTLAVHWAHLVADAFPDGQMFVNLRGFDARGAVVPAEEALAGFLSAIGVPHARIPAGVDEQAELYRRLLAGRRMLIVADNARDAEQVRPLIPGTPGSMVLVTSRDRLTGLTGDLISLDVPTVDDARAELRLRLGDQRAAAEESALDEIIAGCGRLPLAMAVVGARAAAHPLDALGGIAKDIRAGSATLDAFHGDEPAWDLRTVCSWSYRLLSDQAARLFRLLSLHPGPDFGIGTIASLAGAEPRQVVALVRELTRTRLITEHRDRRYVFHDLIRVYAMELTAAHDPVADQQASQNRIVDHLRLTAQAASRQILLARPAEDTVAPPGVTPEPIADGDTAMAWFAAELPMLEATVDYLAGGSFPLWELALPATIYLQRTGRYRTWRSLAQGALTAAVASGDALGEANARRMLAGSALYLGDPDSAFDELEAAHALYERLGLPLDQATALRNMGAVREEQGRAADALAAYEKALGLLDGTDRRQAWALNLLGIGRQLNALGRHHEAIDRVRTADRVLEELGDVNSLADVAEALADIQHSMGRYAASIASRLRAAKVFGEIGNPANESTAYLSLSETYLSAGRPAAAQEALDMALSLADGLGAAEHAVRVRRLRAEFERARAAR